MIKAGLIGCGKICDGHIKAFDTIDDAAIVCACDISEENLEKTCRMTGAEAYTDYKKMMDEKASELDLVIISLPHGLHGEAACYCAEKKVNVFLEKPMGIDSEDCKRMIDCCEKNGVMLWIGHLQRYIRANIFAKDLIKSGKLGELVCFHETRNEDYFSKDRPRWFLDKKMSGGGIMINLAAHSLDKLKFFTDSEIEDICGNVHLREGYDCEDSGQAFVRMANGVTATLNFVGHIATFRNSTELYLTKGEIRINTFGGSVTYCGEDGQFVTEQLAADDYMTLQMQEVCAALREGRKNAVVAGEYGLDIIRAIKRLYGEEN